MDIRFNFKNFEPSEHLKKYAKNRFEKLTKYIPNEDSAEIQINLEVEKFRHKAEIILVGKNLHLSGFEESDDMYSTIDLVLDKVEAQIRKQREKFKSQRRGAKTAKVRMEVISFTPAEGGKRQRTVLTTDHYEPKPMSVDEAAMQLDSRQDEFLVFLNSESERINVIYRRKKGEFGLIDPGM